jgi:SAM-dependent methyltransferase
VPGVPARSRLTRKDTLGAMGDLAAYFDQWYRDMQDAPVKDEIEQRHLGLPPHLQSTSMLGWEGIGELTEALRLGPGDVLLDLACGRGGYGLEVAHRTGARLVGVDLSAVAVANARDQASALGRQARFEVGRLEGTDLDSASVDAVMVVDAMQFADPPAAAYAEIRRLLRPGGRVVLTCWEPVDRSDDRVPQRLRDVDLHDGLTRAGFVDVQVAERPEWRARERAMWAEAAALDPGDSVALLSLHEEGRLALSREYDDRRVLGSATAPA